MIDLQVVSAPLAAQLRGSPSGSLLEFAALALGQSAPDSESFVVGQGIFEAFGTHIARRADTLRLARRATFFGEERLGVGLGAQGALLPHQFGIVDPVGPEFE